MFAATLFCSKLVAYVFLYWLPYYLNAIPIGGKHLTPQASSTQNPPYRAEQEYDWSPSKQLIVCHHGERKAAEHCMQQEAVANTAFTDVCGISTQPWGSSQMSACAGGWKPFYSV